MTLDARHRAIIAEIQRLMRYWDDLPPEIKTEILRFLKTPEMLTQVNLRKLRKGKLKDDIGGKHFYVV